MTDVPTDAADLTRRFDQAMIDVYLRAKREARYNAGYFLRMVEDRGGLSAAQALLVPGPNVPEGLTELYLRSRLDISMEALVLLSPWCDLFTSDELQTARTRLEERNFDVEAHLARRRVGTRS